MLNISLSNISKRIKKEFCTSICSSNALKEIMEHQSVLYSWKVTGCSIEKSFTFYFWPCFWLSESLKRVCSYMWPESAGTCWVQPVRYSMQTLPIKQHLFGLHSSGNHYPYVHMCLCLCVCVLWVVCVGCWGLLQHIYILFCGTFSRRCGWHEATQPPSVCGSGALSGKQRKLTCTCGDVMLTLPLFAIFTAWLWYLLNKCMCLLVSWKI